MRDAENIRNVESLDIDLMGFIFWPKSSRYVSERPNYLPQKAKKVGVFVNEETETIMQIAKDYALDFIQLHGQESPDFVRSILSVCGDTIATIKAFNIATADDFAQTKPYEGIVDYFLFDTKGKSVGGNGEKFDWNVLSAYNGETPFLLSGGIGPDDAEVLSSYLSVLSSKHCIGIDLNSRFELAPGLKDVATLRKFLNELNRSINCK
jgi:phosphoribosylanthranilate isomerase